MIMTKKIIAVILAVIMCVGVGCVKPSETPTATPKPMPTPTPGPDRWTPEETIERSALLYPARNAEFRYNVYTHYVEISRCLTTASQIVIPSEIDGKPVLAIADGAFKGNTTMSFCEIGSKVRIIGAGAFENCTALEYVKIPRSVKTLGNNAFKGCTGLLSVHIPSGISVIPTGAFANCQNLRSVSIEPGGAGRSIQGSAFAQCNLTHIWIPSSVTDINASAMSGSTTNLTVYGEAGSAAAQFAKNNLRDSDYIVLTPREFLQLAKSAVENTPVIGTSIRSKQWEIKLLTAELASEINGIQPSEVDHHFLLLTFETKNITQSDFASLLNPLLISVSVNGGRKPMTFFADSVGGKALVGGYMRQTEYRNGYLVVEIPANWTSVRVDFGGCDDFTGPTGFRITPHHLFASEV